MAGGEGGVHRRRDQQGDGGVDGEGPYPADERLESKVAEQEIQSQPAGHAGPQLSGLWDRQQDRRQ